MNMFDKDQIRQLRLDLGMTAQQFADRLGVHVDTVWKWERGVRHPIYSMMVELNKLKESKLSKRSKQPA